MAGQPVVNPLSNLGPAPRTYSVGQPPEKGASPDLQFYTPPTGAIQPGGFAPPGAALQPPMPPQAGGFQQGFPSGGFQSGGYPASGFMGQPPQPSTFSGQLQPGAFPPAHSSSFDDMENEPPLLEELGINVEHIWLRMQGVAFFKRLDEDVLRDADLSGPLVICLALGTALLLAGKLQFGYIYGLAAGGSFGICMLINVMSQRGGIDLYRTMSILGYGLIPIVILAIIGIFVSLKSTFGTIASALCIAWSTATSSRFFATAISMHQQRWLVAYPVGLVYTFFTLITIF